MKNLRANTVKFSFYDKVYEAVKRIPKGKVSTYGFIAALAGSPRASRAVGYALHRNPDSANIPCHRIVNRDGMLAPSFVFGGIDEQARRLTGEGVEVKDNKVDLSKYAWTPQDGE